MSKFNIGDTVYRRTINNHVLCAWEIIAMRRGWFQVEYFLKSTDKSLIDLLVIETERNLFAVPKKTTRNYC